MQKEGGSVSRPVAAVVGRSEGRKGQGQGHNGPPPTRLYNHLRRDTELLFWGSGSGIFTLLEGSRERTRSELTSAHLLTMCQLTQNCLSFRIKMTRKIQLLFFTFIVAWFYISLDWRKLRFLGPRHQGKNFSLCNLQIVLESKQCLPCLKSAQGLQCPHLLAPKELFTWWWPMI